MENGSFQTPFSNLSSLDFREELPPTPNQVPATAAEIRSAKSSTVEAVLAQNEDLMARLKVTLRRLTALEEENDRLRELQNHARTQISALSDQLLVWQEKEGFWLQKNQKLEADMAALKKRFPEFEYMEEKLERYKKYHEKIRTQVKPYIQQLKGYAQNLALEIRKLNDEIEAKEVRRLEVEKRLHQLRTDIDDRLRQQDEQNRQLVQIYEQEKDRLRLELNELRKINVHLEDKADRLDAALTRQDELENLIVALRRSKEEDEEQIRALKKTTTQDRCRIEDLEAKLKAADEEINRHKHRAEQNEEQLTSLRFLWTSKSEEIEKLQVRIQSLEKINQELSFRLNQVRKGEASL